LNVAAHTVPLSDIDFRPLMRYLSELNFRSAVGKFIASAAGEIIKIGTRISFKESLRSKWYKIDTLGISRSSKFIPSLQFNLVLLS